ncbi:MAG: hypothetical protein RBR34_04430 [Rhodospirillaceae bacterium]|nr:hypothetical protein [Rhodospirillaceae bacterium]
MPESGAGAPCLVVDLDGSLAHQQALGEWIAQGKAQRIEAGDLAAKLRIVASRKAVAELDARLDAVWPRTEPPLIFYGSGDFHHLAARFIARVQEPMIVLHFDNHPDWVTFPKTLNCGGWVSRALEHGPVTKVVTIGPASDDFIQPQLKFANLAALREGSLEMHPWRAAPSRLWGRPVDAPGCETIGGRLVWRELATGDFDGFLDELDGRLAPLPLWITLDKDVLSPNEATTNWDQGGMSLDLVFQAIRRLSRSRRLLGMDVCGDYSKPRYSDPFRYFLSVTDHPTLAEPDAAALAINDRTNRRILDAFGGFVS